MPSPRLRFPWAQTAVYLNEATKKLKCAGCKTACSTCVEVMSKAQTRLRRYSVDLLFYDGGANKERSRVNLNMYHADIRDLNLDEVLPAA